MLVRQGTGQAWLPRGSEVWAGLKGAWRAEALRTLLSSSEDTDESPRHGLENHETFGFAISHSLERTTFSKIFLFQTSLEFFKVPEWWSIFPRFATKFICSFPLQYWESYVFISLFGAQRTIHSFRVGYYVNKEVRIQRNSETFLGTCSYIQIFSS